MLATRFWRFYITGGAEISVDAEYFGSPQAVTDNCETHRDSLIDGHAMQATKQWQARNTGITLQPTLTQYTQ